MIPPRIKRTNDNGAGESGCEGPFYQQLVDPAALSNTMFV